MTEGAGKPVSEALEASMSRALKDNPAPTPTEVLEAAERLLDKVLRTECENRAAALDLLTVDALMTRALELAVGDPKSLESFAEEAMTRLGRR